MLRLTILLVGLAVTLCSSSSYAQQRLALLIGNQGYSDAVGPLKNPHNDVARVGRALGEVGFTLLDPLKDATRDDMLFGVHKLADRLRKAGPGAIGFLYYTGHGIAVGGENVLIPKNVESTSDAELSVRGVRLAEVIDILKNNAPDAVHFIVLDACRNNIRGQKGAKGFAPVNDQRAGVVLAFATAAGETASDDGVGSGPYAAALADEIVVPGRSDQAVFNAIRSRVVVATARHQTPWTHDGLIGERIVFKAVDPPRPAAGELTYKKYIEAFEAQRPILKGSLFPREAFGDLVHSVLERSTEQFKDKTWNGGDDWGRIVFDHTGRSAKYYEPSGREAGEILIQGVMSDSGHSFGGTRGVTRSAELVGEWHQGDGKGEGGFILRFSNNEVIMSWGPLFRRESRWRPSTNDTTSGSPVRFSEAAEAWDRIKDTTSIVLLEAFSARYKDTFYADMARTRIEELKKQQVAVMAPPPATKPAAPRPVKPAVQETPVPTQAPGTVFRDCPDCPEMVVIPAGSFMMGSNDLDDEKPLHRVNVTKPFAVGKFAVTFAEWDACVSADGCKHKPEDRGWGRGTRPVINVSWDDATKEYLPWLSRMTGKTYRLLTEAEWEYAARAGTTTTYSWGSDIGKNLANCNGCGSQWDNKQTSPVGSFKPNAFGLYDMHGNVWQWVQDCYHANYRGAPTDSSAWVTSCTDGSRRVLRGGSWIDNPRSLRAAYRIGYTSDVRGNYSGLGFRLARTLNP